VLANRFYARSDQNDVFDCGCCRVIVSVCTVNPLQRLLDLLCFYKCHTDTSSIFVSKVYDDPTLNSTHKQPTNNPTHLFRYENPSNLFWAPNSPMMSPTAMASPRSIPFSVAGGPLSPRHSGPLSPLVHMSAAQLSAHKPVPDSPGRHSLV
jgi:hypothetical protein